MALGRIRAGIIPRLVQSQLYDPNYFPIPTSERPTTNQRWVGGAGASDSNDGVIVEHGGSGPWANLENGLEQTCGTTDGSLTCININDDLSVGQFDSKFWGAGSGSLSNPILIRPAPGLLTRPTLTLNGRVEIDGQSNWLWYGFHMAGSHGINLGEDTVTTHHTFRNLTGQMSGNGGDNHGFLQALNRNVKHFGVLNCDFIGPGYGNGNGGTAHNNSTCVIAFAVTDLLWSGNIFRNAPVPAYFKHSNWASDGPANIQILNNWIPQVHGYENCFFAGRANGGILRVANNIFESTVQISNGGGGEQPEGHEFIHNTFRKLVQIQNGNQPAINGTYYNNIFEDNLEILAYNTANANTNLLDYNLFGGNIRYNNTTHSTVQSWRGNSVPANQDVNSIDGSPTYEGGANPTTVAGFKLASASNGYQAANDGFDMGADVSKVGVM